MSEKRGGVGGCLTWVVVTVVMLGSLGYCATQRAKENAQEFPRLIVGTWGGGGNTYEGDASKLVGYEFLPSGQYVIMDQYTFNEDRTYQRRRDVAQVGTKDIYTIFDEGFWSIKAEKSDVMLTLAITDYRGFKASVAEPVRPLDEQEDDPEKSAKQFTSFLRSAIFASSIKTAVLARAESNELDRFDIATSGTYRRGSSYRLEIVRIKDGKMRLKIPQTPLADDFKDPLRIEYARLPAEIDVHRGWVRPDED